MHDQGSYQVSNVVTHFQGKDANMYECKARIGQSKAAHVVNSVHYRQTDWHTFILISLV